MILTFDLDTECVILRRRALVLRGLCRLFADDIAERDWLAERVDQHIKLGFKALVIEGNVALVETNGANVHHPTGWFGIRILGIELERPVRTTVGQALQIGIGPGQVNSRDDHTLRQQSQGRNAQLHALERDHLWLL